MDGEHLTLEGVVAVAYAPSKGQAVEVVLSEKAWRKVRRAQRAVEEFIAWGEVVHGVTTSFGAFKDRIIPPDQVQQLQRNILMSPAVGVGQSLEEATTWAIGQRLYLVEGLQAVPGAEVLRE